MRYILFLLTVFMFVPASAQQPVWYLLPREQGCIELKALIRMEGLPRTPVSPEDFARMLRERGEQAAVVPLTDTPPEYVGRIVQVKYGNGRAPIFVREEICERIEQESAKRPGKAIEPGTNPR